MSMSIDPRVLSICGIYTQSLTENRSAFIQFVSLILLAVFFLFGSLWWLYRRRRKQAILHPWEKIILDLQKIDLEAYQSKKEFKNLYYDLTRLVKWYVEHRFLWPVMVMTDAEFAQYLEGVNLDPKLVQKITPIFEHALGIKYADEQALRTHALDDVRELADFVHATIPKQAP